MKEKTHGLILIIVFAMFMGFTTTAQNNFGSEKELRKQAENLFKDDEYAAALPMFSQLLSLYPKDPNFNFKYGVCLLYAKENKEKPLPYLIFAAGKEDVDDDIYYHLGRAYHLNYRFDEAIAQYNIFKQKKSKTSTKLEVDLQIKQCENGKNLLRNVTDITVIEKKELNTSDYFRAYDLNKIAAKLVVKPEELKTPFDVKKKDQSTVVLRQTSQEVYYSSYGTDGKNGRDIYKIAKLPNFTWGQPVNLGPNINTMYDEDFPNITPDGKTLYFCSKGHNSMGGYDVFKSELNPSGEWNKPQNLDFAVNTPDDDIQYITDPESDFAYFSSKRNSADGRIIVFKIKTERVPVTAAIIKGKFLSDAIPVNLAAKISIKNVQTGKFIGTFNSSDKDGKYRLNLNNGAKYEFTVEQSGTPPITQMVEIPPMKELRPLKQEIQLKKKDGATTMIIYNFFSDTVENNALATAELFKERANLDVNYDEQVQAGIISEAANKAAPDNKVLSNRNAYQETTPTSKSEIADNNNNQSAANNEVKNNNTNNSSAQTAASAENGKAEKTKSGINNAELVTIAKEDAKETQKEADELRDKSRQAYAFANLKNNAAQKKFKDASDADNAAGATSDLGEKQLQLDIATKAKKEGDNLSQQAVVAYNLAKDMEAEADAKQAEANQEEQYANDLDLAVKSNSTEALEKLEKQSKELEKNQTPTKQYTPDNLSKLSQEKNAEATRLEERKNDLKAEIQEAMFDEKIAREEVLKSKTDETKEINEAKLKSVLEAKKAKETELSGIDNKIEKIKEEAVNLEEEARINKEIMTEIASGNNGNLTQIAQEDKQKLDAQFSTQRNTTASSSKNITNNQTATNNNSNNQTAIATNNTNQTSTLNTNNQTQSSTNSNQTKTSNINSKSSNAKEEDYNIYANSFDENKKDALMIEAQTLSLSADSIGKLLNNATDNNEIASLSNNQKKYQEVAASKKIAANLIAYNIYNKEYESNKNALDQKLNNIPEIDKANFTNSLSQINGDYEKVITNKTNALQQNNIIDKDANLNTSINAQNVVLVRQRKLLEEAKSSIANSNGSNKATESFKGFNTDRNSSATEAVNNLRPNYTNYNTSVKIAVNEAEEIKRTEDFLKFKGILDQAITFEQNADKKASEYNNTKASGEEKIIESQQLIDLAAEEKKKAKKQALAEEAIRVDNEGKDLLVKADTIKIQAQNEMLKAAAVKAEADKVLSSLDKTRQEKILAVYQNQLIEAEQKLEEKNEIAVDNNKTEVKETVEPKENQNITNNNKEVNNVANVNNSTNTNTSTPENKTPKENKETTVTTNTNQENTTKVTEPEVTKAANPVATNVPSKSKDKEKILSEIKATSDYKEYAAIKDEIQVLNQSAKGKRTEADSVKVQAQRDAINSNDLFEFAAAQPKKKDRKEAQLKAEEMDRVSKANEAKADSLNILAENAEAEARMKQYQADDFLRKFDDATAKTLLMAYNNTVPDELLQPDEPVIASNAKSSNKNPKDNKVVNGQNNEQNVGNKQSDNTSITNAKTEPNKQNQNAENEQANQSVEIANSENNSNQNALPVLQNKAPKPDVRTTVEYVKYVGLKQEAEQAELEAVAWKQRVDSTKALSNQKLDESNNKLDEASNLKKRKRKPLIEEAAALDYEAQLLSRSADSLRTFETEAIKKADDKKAEAEQYFSTIDKVLALRIMRSIQGIPEPVEVEVLTENTNKQEESKNNSAPVAANIGIKKGKPHNTINPIKINEALPNGLIFKVQIGAFNKPVADNAFGTVSPITGETIPNSKLIRYTAGLFTNFDEASKARKELNGLNFKDAFIVAYCYGKRMSVSEARALIAAGKDCNAGGQVIASQNVINSNNNNAVNNNATNQAKINTNNSEGNNEVVSNNNTNPPTQIKAGETLPQQDIQTIKGLLYTVQVGVYSKAVKAGQLFNITPLYYELNQKGQYRYTSGIFNDVREASKAKDIIVQIGVSDAFVSAYINGKRIPMEQAAAMEAQQGKSVFAQVQGMNVQPKVIPIANNIEQRKTIIEEQKITPVVANNITANIVYKVQLGAFRNEVPVEIMNKYLTIADKGIANFKNGDLTIYTVGNYKDAETAESVKAEVVAKGITDAFVIALNNGEKISLEEAKKLGGK